MAKLVSNSNLKPKQNIGSKDTVTQLTLSYGLFPLATIAVFFSGKNVNVKNIDVYELWLLGQMMGNILFLFAYI